MIRKGRDMAIPFLSFLRNKVIGIPIPAKYDPIASIASARNTTRLRSERGHKQACTGFVACPLLMLGVRLSIRYLSIVVAHNSCTMVSHSGDHFTSAFDTKDIDI